MIPGSGTDSFIGQSAPMKDILSKVEKIAPTDANILIMGENGTGKDLMAGMIHERSGRAAKQFVKVDVGALTETLFESELFGHKKGAFTDARDDRTGSVSKWLPVVRCFWMKSEILPCSNRPSYFRLYKTVRYPAGIQPAYSGGHPADLRHQPAHLRTGQRNEVQERPDLPDQYRGDHDASA